MADSRIEIKGLDKLVKGLAMLGKMDDAKDALAAGGEHLKEKIANYPARKYVSIADAGGWASKKQMVYVIAMLASGAWDFPYRRGQSDPSEDLGQKWNVRIINNGFGASVGNNVSYGPYVQGPDKQSKMMELRGWKTTDEVAKEESKTVIEMVIDGLEAAIKRI